jgi:hypothetical protein
VTLLARLWWLPAAAITAGVVARDWDAPPADDLPFFAQAAERLLSRDWAATFASPDVQAGPLWLLLVGLCRSLDEWLGLPAFALLALALVGGTTAGFLLLLRREVVPRPRGPLGAAVASTVLAGGLLPHHAFTSGHGAQVVVPLLWLWAGSVALRGRPVLAGLLVGASAGFEAWGLLGVPVLLAAPHARRSLPVAVPVAVLVPALLLAPFALAGEVRTFELDWYVAPETLPALVLGTDAAFGWPLRLVQGGLALLAAGVAARALRGRFAGVLAAAGAAIAIRLALDPILFSWYWLALEAVAAVALGAALTHPALAPRSASAPAASRV